MIRLESISKIYPTGPVLQDITWEIKAGQRLGLIGCNGAGKTTQLKIIAGLEEPTTGKVCKQGDPLIAYLQQEFDVDIRRTVREELFQAFAQAAKCQKKMQTIESLMASKKASLEQDYLNELIKQLGVLQSHFEALNGYELQANIEKLLPTISFTSEDADRLVGDFSGGWQMRIALGKILLQKPDVLLLDEPTNHLDIETITWLENYLVGQKTAIVIISHDRQFLDRVCTHTVVTERGISKTYLGNYTFYLEKKKLDNEAQQSAYEKQQKDFAEQQAYIDRFRASASRSTQAKSREKLLSKVERIEGPNAFTKKPTFHFPLSQRSGKEVISIKEVSHTYDEKIIFLGANLEISRGDHIAILGANGSGKSTLLRLIAGLEKPDDGNLKLGSHNVVPRYFQQNQSEALDLDKTLIDTLFEVVPDWTQTKVRTLLGNLGFSDDSVFKEVKYLSGGEKSRLAFALIIVQPCNLLLLDEPTNHLDIPAKEMLEEAIIAYQGTIISVSHDRYFISRIANKIVEIRDGDLFLYNGNYDYYLEKKNQEKILLEEQIFLAKREAKRIAKKKKSIIRKNKK